VTSMCCARDTCSVVGCKFRASRFEGDVRTPCRVGRNGPLVSLLLPNHNDLRSKLHIYMCPYLVHTKDRVKHSDRSQENKGTPTLFYSKSPAVSLPDRYPAVDPVAVAGAVVEQQLNISGT